VSSDEYRNWEPDSLGQLPVLCWCEGKIVYVRPEVVKNGGTKSCGKERCQPRS
jgi:hypothetical protein